MSASNLTLATLRDRVEQLLSDTGNAIWAEGDIDAAIRQALAEYSKVNRLRAITTSTLSADTRELDISTVTGLLGVERVWYPYTVATPEHPPDWRHFEHWRDAEILYFPDDAELQNGEIARIFYTKVQTLSGLDSATATTFPVDDDELLSQGAAGYAASGRSLDLMEEVTLDRLTSQQIRAWGLSKLQEFRAGLRVVKSRLALAGTGIIAQPGLDKWDGDWS